MFSASKFNVFYLAPSTFMCMNMFRNVFMAKNGELKSTCVYLRIDEEKKINLARVTL